MKLCLWSPEFFWTIIVSICFHWLSMIPLFTESHKKTCWWKTTIWSPLDVWCYFTGWFRPIFDLPIPPLYQPSTIETVARDRSPRHSAEKWKFWVWKPSKKLVKPFPTLWKYIYIYALGFLDYLFYSLSRTTIYCHSLTPWPLRCIWWSCSMFFRPWFGIEGGPPPKRGDWVESKHGQTLQQ